jgi:hypothetical protein
MGTYLLREKNTYQITTFGSSTATLNSLGGTSEPFAKVFHADIIVESQDSGISKFKGPLETHNDLDISGSLSITNHVTISGSSTINTADLDTVILVTTTGSAVTLQIPGTSGITKGRVYFFKKIGGTNTFTIDPSGTTTIDGALTLSTTDASASMQLMSSGAGSTGYYIISQYGTWT